MGLIVSVYRNAEIGDTTNGGLSGRVSRLTVVNVEGPFEPTEDRPAVLLEVRVQSLAPYARVVPAVRGEGGAWEPERRQGSVGPMFGGNVAFTSDSRWRRAVGVYPACAAIHDRFETAEQYRAMGD